MVNYYKSRKNSILKILSILIVSFIIILLCSCAGSSSTKGEIEFSKESWENFENRLPMAKYLINSEYLIDLSKGEVLDLLGEKGLSEHSVFISYDIIETDTPLKFDVYFKDDKVERCSIYQI